MIQALDFLLLQRLHSEQGVDEEAVAALRGHASGRGVRAGDEAELLEVRHDVAYRGRAQVQPRTLRERARADRLAIVDVMLDQGLEQDLCAFV